MTSLATFKHDDQQGPVTQLTGLPALTAEQWRDTGFIMYWFRHDQDDEVQLTIQFSHRKRLLTNLDGLHLHVGIGADPGVAQDVVFQTIYTWVNPTNMVIPAITGWTTAPNAVYTIQPGTVNKTAIIPLVSNITYPASEGYSSMLFAKVTRLGSSSGLDTYTTSKGSGTAAANLAFQSVDAHYIVDRNGSTLEYSDV